LKRHSPTTTQPDAISNLPERPVLRQRRFSRRPLYEAGHQLLLRGLVDAHSHGRGLSPIQKGVRNDFLENTLFDWAYGTVLPQAMTVSGHEYRFPRREPSDRYRWDGRTFAGTHGNVSDAAVSGHTTRQRERLNSTQVGASQPIESSRQRTPEASAAC
jgi:hypothetical protein